MTLSEDRATGALWAFRFDPAGRGRFVADQHQRDCLDPAEGWSWLHFPLSEPRARLLHEEIGEQVNAAANRSLKVLTVLSTLLLPPTLIVGAFGMNVQGIPWAHDFARFAEASAFCVLAVAVSYVALKV